MIDFKQNLYTEIHNFPEAMEIAGLVPADIKTSDEISGIEIRLSHVIVKNNKSPRILGLFGFAKVYFINIVISDLATNSISLTLNGFEKIRNNDALHVDRTLFYWKKDENHPNPPSQVHVMSSIVKSKESLRNVGEIMTKIDGDTDYKNLVTDLSTLVKTAANMSVISDVIFKVAGIVGKYLGNVDDKPLLTWIQSFTDVNGDWDKQGETDKSAENSFAAMHLGLMIRDAERQKLAESEVK